MNRLFFTLTMMLGLNTLFGQGLQTLLEESAVKIKHIDKLEQAVYDKLSDFRLVMIGEMHGTNEPANFVVGLAELFASNKDTVQVGFEIPSELMPSHFHSFTDSSILQSEFFLNKFDDGRASIAWANAITRLAKKSSIQIFFYDINPSESSSAQGRDSVMYVKIKEKMLEHPNWRTITLSGNVHNMRLPFKEQLTTAYYLCIDKELNLSDKICSLSHYYQSGTMFNSSGNILELRQINNPPSIFSVYSDNFLFLYPTANAYNGIFFTKTVTASEPANKK